MPSGPGAPADQYATVSFGASDSRALKQRQVVKRRQVGLLTSILRVLSDASALLRAADRPATIPGVLARTALFSLPRPSTTTEF